MTILDGVLVGVITLIIAWIATPFGKPIRKGIEDWLNEPSNSKEPPFIAPDKVSGIQRIELPPGTKVASPTIGKTTIGIYGDNIQRIQIDDRQKPNDEFISMKDAARKFYEAARAGKISNAHASEQLSGWSSDGPSRGSPEDILHWWAEHISKEVPIYGRRPPSSIIEEIPAPHVRSFLFAEEATKMKDPMNDLAYYIDLCVKTDALDAQYNFEAGFHGTH